MAILKRNTGGSMVFAKGFAGPLEMECSLEMGCSLEMVPEAGLEPARYC